MPKAAKRDLENFTRREDCSDQVSFMPTSRHLTLVSGDRSIDVAISHEIAMAASTEVIPVDSSPAPVPSQLPASTRKRSVLCSSPKADGRTDRLPTVSASEALQGLRSSYPASIATGLPDLDKYLAGGACIHGGFERGKVTELWGPIGAGKTAIL